MCKATGLAGASLPSAVLVPRAPSAWTQPCCRSGWCSAGSCSQGALRARGWLPAARPAGQTRWSSVFQSIEDAQSLRCRYQSLHTSASEGFQMKSLFLLGEENVKGEGGFAWRTKFPPPSVRRERLCPITQAAEGEGGSRAQRAVLIPPRRVRDPWAAGSRCRPTARETVWLSPPSTQA